MSSEGIVGALVGGVIGSFIPGVGPLTGAKYGYAIGSTLGADGPEDQFGPRLSDLKVQSSAYGAPIPIIYGKARVSGNVIWAKPIRERKIEEDAGGKGGGGSTVTTYEYYGSFAVALCDNEIAGVRKIWADSKLIYNVGNTASLETIQASNRQADKITIYYGTEAQEADSLIQSDKGATNTQAYRGTAYIVFDDLLLEKYGNRIPNITAEILTTASVSIRKVEEFTTPEPVFFSNSSMPYVDGSKGLSHLFVGQWDNSYATTNIKYFKSYSNDILEEFAEFSLGSNYNNLIMGSADEVICVSGNRGTFTRDRVRARLYDGDTFSTLSYSTSDTLGLSKPLSPDNSIFCLSDDNIYILYDDPSEKYLFKGTVDAGVMASLVGDFSQLAVIQSDADLLTASTHSFTVSNGIIYILNTDNTIDKFDTDGGFIETISFTPSPSISYQTVGENYPVLRIEGDVIWVVSNTRLYKIVNGDIDYIGALSTSSYGNYGGTSVSDGVVYLFRATSANSPYGLALEAYQIESTTAGSISLSSIVSDIDERAGLDAADDDTTALTDTVEGYVVTRPMSARAAIEPLQKAFFFDAAEIDNVLTYVKRGGSVTANIPEIDLGSVEYGQESNLYTQTRQQDSELPAEITVDYIDLNRSYQEGSQRAQRINSPQENIVKVSLPIVGTANYFKEVAHVLLYNAHTERERFEISLTGEYIGLNPTDVINFTVDSDTRKARITKITYGDNLLIEALAEDSTIYSAESVAGEGEETDQTVGLDGPTKMYLMDIPLLRNQDNDAGMYVACSGYFSAWTGAQIFKSLDGGTSYSPVEDVLAASAMGKATTVLADADHTTFDRTSTVTVSLTSGTLSSSTESAVIQGANYFALINANGVEIGQFVNAVDNGDDTYTLSTLLRGRRGTDWATGIHAVGDLFCLLRENFLERVGAAINNERYYKPVTFGTFLEEADAQTKTNTGVNQKPFSPKYIGGTRDGSNNLTITWTRRSRYIGTPLWDLPVFEESESYKIEILDAPGGSVINTYTSSSESYVYTAAQQTSDGLTPGNTVYVNIYQVGIVDGYGTEATL